MTRLLLLADQSRWQSMGSGFRGSRATFDVGDLLIGMALLIGAIVAAQLLSRLLARQGRQGSYNSPRALFRELCRAHNLSWKDRWLLGKVARYQRLLDPGRLFLEAERLEPVNLSRDLLRSAARLEALRGRLFSESAKAAGEREEGPRKSPESQARLSRLDDAGGGPANGT